MSNTKHTPGPWYVRNFADVFTENGAANRDGLETPSNTAWYIAYCAPDWTVPTEDGEETSLSHEEIKANAYLIAAAPELLEALKQLVDLDNAGIVDREPWARAMKQAREAVNKAKGGAE